MFSIPQKETQAAKADTAHSGPDMLQTQIPGLQSQLCGCLAV